MTRIYTLEDKGNVLAILTHTDMTYRKFKEICAEVAEATQSDFYEMKDILIHEYNFEIVEACGGFEVRKGKGTI